MLASYLSLCLAILLYSQAKDLYVLTYCVEHDGEPLAVCHIQGARWQGVWFSLSP